MKYFLLFFIFSVSFTTVLLAQDKQGFNKNKTSFGLKTATSLNSVSSHFLKSENNRSFGFFLESELDDSFSILVEANYTRPFGISFVEMPVLLRYRLTDKINVFSGLKLSYLANDRNVLSRNPNPFGLSIVLGGQYNINSKWFIDARYSHGLTEQINFTPELGTHAKSTMNSFSFGLGYRF